MSLTCYWCHNPITHLEKFPSIAQCSICEDIHSTITYTCFTKENATELAHIYTKNIHITMRILDKVTIIADRTTELPIFTIDGCPFTLDNFDNKLRTYLLFS